jgi:glycerophosphoryl diester phosphodiesterase
MSKDGVVVICHDALLKRLYGVDDDVRNLPWKGGLDQLLTVREPRCPMMTFRELVGKLMAQEGETDKGATKWTDTWILMDIKVSHDATVLTR